MSRPALFSPPTDEFTFLVELWNPDDMKVEKVLAGAQNIRLARAAYEVAVEIYPDRKVKLRAGARVILPE